MIDKISRRELFALIGAGGVYLSCHGLAGAQGGGSLCSFSRMTGGGRLDPATNKARGVVDSVARALGMSGRIDVFQSNGVQNAAAHPVGGVGPYNTIVYNPDFLNKLHQAHPAAPVSVLAHEVGHFTPQGAFAPHPWTRELTADYVSGCAMRRLDNTEEEATIALRTMFDMFGSPSHPDTPRRLEAMMQGFYNC